MSIKSEVKSENLDLDLKYQHGSSAANGASQQEQHNSSSHSSQTSGPGLHTSDSGSEDAAIESKCIIPSSDHRQPSSCVGYVPMAHAKRQRLLPQVPHSLQQAQAASPQAAVTSSSPSAPPSAQQPCAAPAPAPGPGPQCPTNTSTNTSTNTTNTLMHNLELMTAAADLMRLQQPNINEGELAVAMRTWLQRQQPQPEAQDPAAQQHNPTSGASQAAAAPQAGPQVARAIAAHTTPATLPMSMMTGAAGLCTAGARVPAADSFKQLGEQLCVPAKIAVKVGVPNA